MSDHKRREPFSESNLDSPEYRERLLRKLNCLIALLEVAMARVRQSLAGPDPDVERLIRICGNLQSTLDVCLRARSALERRESLPAELPSTLAQVSSLANAEAAAEEVVEEITPPSHPLPAGAGVEMSSPAETRKFEALGPIEPRMVRRCDFDDLARRLLAS